MAGRRLLGGAIRVSPPHNSLSSMAVSRPVLRHSVTENAAAAINPAAPARRRGRGMGSGQGNGAGDRGRAGAGAGPGLELGPEKSRVVSPSTHRRANTNGHTLQWRRQTENPTQLSRTAPEASIPEYPRINQVPMLHTRLSNPVSCNYAESFPISTPALASMST